MNKLPIVAIPKDKMTIERTFHPIGQGAFYTETHPDFNFVYDCGVQWTKRYSLAAKEIVKRSFRKGSTIDLLFISHFDFDHVGLIPQLLKSFKIKTVVLPLLHEKEKQIVSRIYHSLGASNGIIKLVQNPENFFDKETRIILVNPYEGGPFEPEAVEAEVVDLDKIGPFKERILVIESGTKLRIKYWLYMPFNIEYESRSEQLKYELEYERLNRKQLTADPNYIVANRAKIKRIYNRIKGDINQNSMITYSGPLDFVKKKRPRSIDFAKELNPKTREHTLEFLFGKKPEILIRNIGCIYTGDSDLSSQVDIRKLFKDQWNQVGTIQIPHHGSEKSYSSSLLDNVEVYCPLSYGTYNKYCHPSAKVIVDIMNQKCKPYEITEDPTSIFSQLLIKS